MNSAQLKPGDLLLYRPKKGSFFGWLISVKTWNKISHCELYVGDHQSIAARDGIGVNMYPLRESELAMVLRPKVPLDVVDMLNWFETVRGQKYDWLGLLVFTLAVKQGSTDKMFCSEFCTRALRAGGVEPFTVDTDADRVAPATFLYSPAFDVKWKDGL